jgi:arabinogalactan oligomer/maltooligosaccharide transport system substrate-binding protein
MNEVWTPWGQTEADIISGKATDPAATWEKMVKDIQDVINSKA